MESVNDLFGRLNELQAQIVLLFEGALRKSENEGKVGLDILELERKNKALRLRVTHMNNFFSFGIKVFKQLNLSDTNSIVKNKVSLEQLQRHFWMTVEEMGNCTEDEEGESADDVLGQPKEEEIDFELYANGCGIVSQKIEVNEFDCTNFDNAEQPSAVDEPGTSRSEASVKQSIEVDSLIPKQEKDPAAEQIFESLQEPLVNSDEETLLTDNILDRGLDGTSLSARFAEPGQSTVEGSPRGANVPRIRVKQDELFDERLECTPVKATPELIVLDEGSRPQDVPPDNETVMRMNEVGSCIERACNSAESTTQMASASGGNESSRRQSRESQEGSGVTGKVRTNEGEDPTASVLPSTSGQVEAMGQTERSPVFNRGPEGSDFTKNCSTPFVLNDEQRADLVRNVNEPAMPHLKLRKKVPQNTAPAGVESNAPNGPPNGMSAASSNSRENVSVKEATAPLNTVNLERINREIENRENENCGGPGRDSVRERQVGPEGDDDDIIMGSPGWGSQVFHCSRGRGCRRSRSADEFVRDPHCSRPHTSVAVDMDETFISPSVVRNFNFPSGGAVRQSGNARRPIKRHAREMSPDYNSVPYAYKRDAVRKRRERMRLPGHACVDCKKYYKQAYGDANTNDFKGMLNLCSRHRDWHPADFDDTPAGFWTPFLTCTNNCTANCGHEDDDYESDA